MNISNLSAAQLRRAAQIKEQLDNLQTELNKILGGESGAAGTRGGKRQLSPAARARIVAAQKARWQKFHAAKAAKK